MSCMILGIPYIHVYIIHKYICINVYMYICIYIVFDFNLFAIENAVNINPMITR